MKKVELKAKTAKIGNPVYQTGLKVRRYIAQNGLNSLPKEILSPTNCPICGDKMEIFEIRYRHLKCKNCGYTQQDFSFATNFGLGLILGLGIASLVYLIFRRQ